MISCWSFYEDTKTQKSIESVQSSLLCPSLVNFNLGRLESIIKSFNGIFIYKENLNSMLPIGECCKSEEFNSRSTLVNKIVRFADTFVVIVYQRFKR